MHLSVAGIAVRNDHVLLARRKPGGVNSGRWEFPGGKSENEPPAACLEREFLEELGVSVSVGPLLARGAFTHRGEDYRLEAYRVRLGSEKLTLHEHAEVGWFRLEEAEKLELVPSDRALLPQLRRAI